MSNRKHASNTRRGTPLILALATALAMPLAFAQDQQADTLMQTSEAASTQVDPAVPTVGETPRKPTWDELDTDRDGLVSQAEAAADAELARIFDQADADADGKLSKDEYRSFAGGDYDDRKPVP